MQELTNQLRIMYHRMEPAIYYDSGYSAVAIPVTNSYCIPGQSLAGDSLNLFLDAI